MIRRLIAVVVLAVALLVLGSTAAGAANGNILCLYAKDPTSLGLCIGV